MIAYWFYRLGHFLAVSLPLKTAYAVADFLSILKYYISPRDRRAVKGNLRKILPENELPLVNQYAKRVFINFGRYMIEFFRTSVFNQAEIKRSIEIKGKEHVDNALKNGKGVIVLTAHVGNWELGGISMALLGYPMTGVALPHRHWKVNKFFNHQRESMGLAVIPSTGLAIRRVYEALANNRVVALVGDRDFAGAGIVLPFLGASKIIPRGPAVLTKRTGAPIIPGFVAKQDDGRYLLEFFPPLNTDAGEEDVIRDYSSVIESIIRSYPDQWLMFREFWKE